MIVMYCRDTPNTGQRSQPVFARAKSQSDKTTSGAQVVSGVASFGTTRRLNGTYLPMCHGDKMVHQKGGDKVNVI